MKKSEDAEICRGMAEMARQFGDRKQADLLIAMAGVFQKTDEEIDLLYDGKEDCTDDESEIITSDLKFEEKMAKLRVLRGNAVVPQKFKKLATDDDTIRAKSWGVKL
jgi:hypothetical protein